jgi:hypothetical protein
MSTRLRSPRLLSHNRQRSDSHAIAGVSELRASLIAAAVIAIFAIQAEKEAEGRVASLKSPEAAAAAAAAAARDEPMPDASPPPPLAATTLVPFAHPEVSTHQGQPANNSSSSRPISLLLLFSLPVGSLLMHSQRMRKRSQEMR